MKSNSIRAEGEISPPISQAGKIGSGVLFLNLEGRKSGRVFAVSKNVHRPRKWLFLYSRKILQIAQKQLFSSVKMRVARGWHDRC
jgi:hypothetical protein